ncbi:hypothetical protein POM88_051908 [Heracleum sosnowskyi]|uniref:Uncharacterized protein n=1 Tax=Heracleum sosnowskyi TaxID=360622 RepID=A0AAD8GS51_9APIA|nr:hypothetical protein POM88_051908 [Heracleum sosnowskyi]
MPNVIKVTNDDGVTPVAEKSDEGWTNVSSKSKTSGSGKHTDFSNTSPTPLNTFKNLVNVDAKAVAAAPVVSKFKQNEDFQTTTRRLLTWDLLNFKPFQLFHYMMEHELFMPSVQEAWEIQVSGNPCYILTTKLKNVKRALENLNSSVGNLHLLVDNSS